MSLSLYVSSIRLSRTSFVAWGAIILVYAFIVAYIYDSFKEATALQDAMEIMPEYLLAAIGVADTEFELFVDGIMDPAYFLNSEYLAWLPLMLSIYAVFYCGGLVSREAERGTLDLLLSQPLARRRLVLSKLATFITMVLVLLTVSWLGIMLGLQVIGVDVSIGRLVLAHVLITPLVLAVSAYSTLFSCLYLDPRRSLAIAGLVTAAMYILNFMAPTLGAARWTANLSLFHHVNLFQTLVDGSVGWETVVIPLAVAAVALGVGLFVFERRDLSY